MSNKRKLKKTINLICESLLAECMAASLYGHNRDSAKSLLYCVIKTESDFISRISHPEPGMPAKQYYNTLKNDFVEQVNEIIDQLNHNH